jgi:prepilin-type N-terminal cleavage/methylation domain-containing protein
MKNKKGFTLVELLAVIAILAMVLLVVGCVVYGYFTGKIIIKENDVTETAEGEQPIYTESQMQEMLEEANEDAEEKLKAEAEKAYEEGYRLGRNELLEFIRERLLTTSSSIRTFNAIFPYHLVVVSKSSYHFIPINRDLAQSGVIDDRVLMLDSGEYQYTDENGNVISHKGIDVSEHQGKIDWKKVRNDGVEFAFVRVLYRGWGSGKLVEDTTGEDNIREAVENGINVGAYVFSQAITPEEAVEEARRAIEIVSPYAQGIPIVIDVEYVPSDDARMDELTPEERTDVILAFCDEVSSQGYIPMIYYNTEMGGLGVENERLEGITKWYAWYSEVPYYPYKYDIWQYSDKGSVDGIKGNVDQNISFNAFWE